MASGEQRAGIGWFRRFSERSAQLMGTPAAFLVAGLVIFLWVVTGPLFHYSDTWQLVINTGTTVITFLAVFLIQNTQNRDAAAIHLKLDELLRAVSEAHTAMAGVERKPEDELRRLRELYHELAEEDEHQGVAEAESVRVTKAKGRDGADEDTVLVQRLRVKPADEEEDDAKAA